MSGRGTRTHRAVRLSFTLLVLASVPLGPSARAGEASDPREGNSKLDIAKLSHSTDAEYVTYRAEMHGGFDNDRDFRRLRWDLDLDGDGQPVDACILVEPAADGVLRASLFPACGPETWATADATKPSDNVVEFKFLIRDLVQGAAVTPGKAFGYRVIALDLQGNRDTAPDDGLVSQDGLPEPPKTEGQPPLAGSSGRDARTDASSDGLPPAGEGGGAPVVPIPTSSAGRSGSFVSRVTGAVGSPMAWLLAIVLPGALLLLVVAAVRRRLPTPSTPAAGALLSPPRELVLAPPVAAPTAPIPPPESSGLSDYDVITQWSLHPSEQRLP